MTTPFATVVAVFLTPIVYVAVFCVELVPKIPDDERDEDDEREEEDRDDELLVENELLVPAWAMTRGALLDDEAVPVEYPSP